MSLHETHTVQPTSVDAYYQERPKLNGRYKSIIECFKKYGQMTARECKDRLGLHDMNQVRPRITELCNKPYEILEAVAEKHDNLTKKTVSVFAIKSEEPVQIGLGL